ncbi:hypothetical protein EKO23_20380 [Nocardioides guangzhouensis]|uniref:Uncharacterized protein n=1 Tax=Nocardioides guangzhouensis TaxID=2497878 RepID=A0A4Q4Z6J7_9ACTN|nr:hypothetical protein [Nocardioides guangzhouensis]RYP82975.1 hypothetical protein EKO23_20380 [Nocardioides guangzhouensis]
MDSTPDRQQDGAVSRIRAAAWLTPVVGMVLAIVVYRDAYSAEAGRYAGDEPALAGLWVAFPFVLLALVQASCAVGASVSKTTQARAAWTSAAIATTATGLLAAFLVV